MRTPRHGSFKLLHHTTPTLPFRSAGLHQRTNTASDTAPALFRLLNAYKPSTAQSVTIGVAGFSSPTNLDKSSLINTLKGAPSRSCFPRLNNNVFFRF
jgi:nuclear GTP-binding protein